MAKKKQQVESGPGVFMILALVFFVLASAVLGVTTYLGFSEQEQYKKEAATANEKQKQTAKNFDEETMRKIVQRIANGTATAEDRTAFSGGASANSAAIQDEIKQLTDKLGGGAFPERNSFTWNLGGEGKADVGPNNDLAAIVRKWKANADNAETKRVAEEAARKKAEAAAAASQKSQEDAKAAYDKSVMDLSAAVDAKLKAMDAAFIALKAEADKKGLDFQNAATAWANDRARLEEAKLGLEKDKQVLTEAVRRAQNPDPSDLEARWRGFDAAKTAEKMGVVSDKDGNFVTLSFSSRINLVPGQTFVVIPPTGSLVEVIDREKAIEKDHYTFRSLYPREPFADNEMIKGMVEVTDVLSPTTARARITHQPSQLRNPIGRNDQIFNLTMGGSGKKEKVAFAGIIDLDGDGRPNNEDFIRLLERNNLEVVAYLDLRSGTIKPDLDRMTSATKFLIIGNDAPDVSNIKAMTDAAKRNSIPMIDARRFLNLIGVKTPSGAAPPAYTGVNLGENVAPKKEGDPAPVPPVVPDPKEGVDPKKQ